MNWTGCKGQNSSYPVLVIVTAGRSWRGHLGGNGHVLRHLMQGFWVAPRQYPNYMLRRVPKEASLSMCIYIYIYIFFLCMHVCMYAYIHKYIHIYTHICNTYVGQHPILCIYIYINICLSLCLNSCSKCNKFYTYVFNLKAHINSTCPCGHHHRVALYLPTRSEQRLCGLRW